MTAGGSDNIILHRLRGRWPEGPEGRDAVRALLKSFRRARELRQNLTLPGVKLRDALSRGRLEGYRFRKQHPIGPFILDFYCSRARLAVEIDGEGHGFGDRPEYDPAVTNGCAEKASRR